MPNEITKTDLHSHDFYSGDSVSSPEQVVEQCIARNIGCLAVTNHNTIQGAEETRYAARMRAYDLMVITGEEITTCVQNAAGKKVELIALFLKEGIPPGLFLRQTLEEIKKQESVVCIPHPFELWRHGTGEELGTDIIQYAKELKIPLIWELVNSRSKRSNNDLSRQFYIHNQGQILYCAGSDAHHAQEIGRADLMLHRWGGNTPEEQKQGFLQSIQKPQGYGFNDDWRDTLRFRVKCRIGRLNPRANFPPSVSS